MEKELFNACSHGNLDAVILLINKGTDVHTTDCEECSPLHAACCHGHLEIASLLIDKGADINDRDKYGWNSLHYACWNGGPTIVKFLIKKGALLTAESSSGTTPFQLATKEVKRWLEWREKNEATIGLLLTKKLPVDIIRLHVFKFL